MRIFHYKNHPASYWGSHMTSWNPPMTRDGRGSHQAAPGIKNSRSLVSLVAVLCHGGWTCFWPCWYGRSQIRLVQKWEIHIQVPHLMALFMTTEWGIWWSVGFRTLYLHVFRHVLANCKTNQKHSWQLQWHFIAAICFPSARHRHVASLSLASGKLT